MVEILLGAVIVLEAVIILLLFLRRPGRDLPGPLREMLQDLERGLRDEFSRSRTEAGEDDRRLREEVLQGLQGFGVSFGTRLDGASAAQNERLEGFQAKLSELVRETEGLRATLREELLETALKLEKGVAEGFDRAGRALGTALGELRDELNRRVEKLTEGSENRIGELRETVERRLRELQESNESRLEKMRETVDEKLHATLERRLGESFQQVSERLEKVHEGLGEMQSLASGVGDLKKIMANVKSRGIWGEAQLGNLLGDTMTPDQYAANVAVNPENPGLRVDYAVRLPGRREGDRAVWLPIDAKFPLEDYQRLVDAQEAGDLPGVEEAGRALERRLKEEAASIRQKYVAPPHTTDFAILFVPTEGLFAEILRRPGLYDDLRQSRVIPAGPTTLSALLNSLQMGFRTLAIERRSEEVWRTLGEVKREFDKFGETVAGVRRKIEAAGAEFEKIDTRTRAIQRRLREVQVLPGEETGGELPE